MMINIKDKTVNFSVKVITDLTFLKESRYKIQIKEKGGIPT